MNLFSETDSNTLYEHPNVLCTVDDTAIATTQVHSSTNEESTNIRGIIQNVTCSVLNIDRREQVTFNEMMMMPALF
jgi:hypothetical protein